MFNGWKFTWSFALIHNADQDLERNFFSLNFLIIFFIFQAPCLSAVRHAFHCAASPRQPPGNHTIPYHTIPYHTIPYHTIPTSVQDAEPYVFEPPRSASRSVIYKGILGFFYVLYSTLLPQIPLCRKMLGS